MRLVFNENERCGAWILERMPYVESLAPGHQTIGLEVGGELSAVAVFEHYTGHDIDVGLAIEGARVTPGLVRATFRYVFDQLACRRLSCEVATKNLRMRSIVERMGFVMEGVKRNGVPGDDLVVFGMLRSECRYL